MKLPINKQQRQKKGPKFPFWWVTRGLCSDWWPALLLLSYFTFTCLVSFIKTVWSRWSSRCELCTMEGKEDDEVKGLILHPEARDVRQESCLWDVRMKFDLRCFGLTWRLDGEIVSTKGKGQRRSWNLLNIYSQVQLIDFNAAKQYAITSKSSEFSWLNCICRAL